MELAARAFDPGTTAGKAWAEVARVLREAGVESPVVDARLLVCHALGTDRLGLLREPNRPVGDAASALADAVKRRLAREPVSRIIGERAFWGRQFSISPATLDPRADSETLIAAGLELAGPLQEARPDRPLRLLDLGTGSGCLLLTLLAELPAAEGIGVDISPEALDVARGNAARLGVAGRAQFVLGDWMACMEGPFDLVLSNPPYIRHSDLASLAPEVIAYDPALALDGGEDGLAAYRQILARPPELNPGGAILFEVGQGQADRVLEMLATAYSRQPEGIWPRALRRWQDLSGIERVVGLAT